MSRNMGVYIIATAKQEREAAAGQRGFTVNT
jgi:hypothetical protein